jgi:hypothetical protein
MPGIELDPSRVATTTALYCTVLQKRSFEYLRTSGMIVYFCWDDNDISLLDYYYFASFVLTLTEKRG